MKRANLFLLSLLAAALLVNAGQIQATVTDPQQQITIVYRGQPAALANELLNVDDRLYCPIRDITDTLGLDIHWSPSAQTITVTSLDSEAVYAIGSNQYFLNGDPIPMDARPFIDAASGRTYLPVRFIAEPFGYKVKWDPASQTIDIDYP